MLNKLKLRFSSDPVTRLKQIIIAAVSALALIVAPLAISAGNAGATGGCTAASTCFWAGEDFTGNTLVLGNSGNTGHWIHITDLGGNITPVHSVSEGGSATAWLYSKTTGQMECLIGTTGDDPDTDGDYGYIYITSNSSTCGSIPTPLP